MSAIDRKYAAHIPAGVLEDLAEDLADKRDVHVRMSCGVAIVRVDGGEPERYYRGRSIEYDDDGVYEKWVAGWGSRAPRFPTLRDAKAYIDAKIAARDEAA